ncbi:MAG: VCBS repeat-containing protein [Candidatus Krumholzibacteriota bacterium]|nr:VCBS repeat-containing protein [Candidatus Krumholzibacteriota bacterium]
MAITVLTSICSQRALCQKSYFPDYPDWSSELANWTYSIALGDIDSDGDLDLACGNSVNTRFYLNEGGVFHLEPALSLESTHSYCLALGDINGDGDLDLVTRDNYGHIVLFLNAGGVFQTPRAWSSGRNADCIVLGDVDSDGDLDLVCNGYYDNALYLNVDGVFQTGQIWSTGETTSMALGDIDSDGDLDLACGTLASNKIYLNDGGIFQQEPIWSSGPGNETRSVAFGDMDGDGDLDLLCGNHSSVGVSQYSVLYLNDEGVFQVEPIWQNGPAQVYSVALGDIDSDGDLDLVSGSSSSNKLYLNDGGVFQWAWSSQWEDITKWVALGDIDGDGDLDLVCGNDRGGFNTLYLNDGNIFQTSPGWSSGPNNDTRSVAIGDIDSDGDIDLVCGNYGQEHNTLYLNDGNVIQTEPAWSSRFGDNTSSVALGDIDLDGDLDLVCGESGASNTLYLNNGNVFQLEPIWSSGPAYDTRSVALGDIDSDGDLDLVCGNYDQTNTLYPNDGGMFQQEPIWVSGPDNKTTSVALGDIDGDGDLDLVCGNDEETNTLYLNDGGVFQTTPAWYSVGEYNPTNSVVLSDIDSDGDLDLVCGNDGNNIIYPNNGGVLNSTPVWFPGPSNETKSIAPGDINDDGFLDLVCGNNYFEEYNNLYLNFGGVFQAEPAWSSLRHDLTNNIALKDIDSDGDLDIVCGNNGSNTIYSGLRAPVYKGDPLFPTNHLPNNGAFLKSVAVEHIDSVSCRIHFNAIDVESDSIWIVVDYQFEGEPGWHPSSINGQTGKVGPFRTSPGGKKDSLIWDTFLVPFDSRDVILRLRTISVPNRVSIIQHIASYLIDVGPIEPFRPEISTLADSLSFETISLGDTASVELVIGNSGNKLLSVNHIDLPSSEMRLSKSAVFNLLPGQNDTMLIYVEPRLELDISGAIEITSNDPLKPNVSVQVTTDIRSLDFQTRLLNPMNDVPLGEALTINMIPGPEVNIEKGFVFYRPSDSGVAFNDSVPILLLPEGDFMAVIPGNGVTEAGLDYYIRVENSGVFAFDPRGAPADSVFHQAVQQPDQISSVPGPNRNSDFLQGRDIKVSVSLPEGTFFEQGTLYYRPGGETEYQEVEIQVGEQLPFATIPDTVPGPRGIEYWVNVRTFTRTLSDPPLTPEINPKSIRVTTTELREPLLHQGEQFRMLSLPLEIQQPLTGVITDDVGGPDNTQWRLYAYENNNNTYSELPNDILFSFEQGRGYWFITREPHQIDTDPAEGLSAPTDSSFSILLNTGYNLTGNPFAFNIAWDSIMVDTIGGTVLSMAEAEMVAVEPPVEWVPGTGYDYDVDILEPFNGFWVKNLMDKDIVLLVPPRKVPAELSANTSSNLPDPNTDDDDSSWIINIQALSQDSKDLENYIGVDPGASDGWDTHDRSDAPMPPGNNISLYFPHNSWRTHKGNYSSDIRRGYQEFRSEEYSTMKSEYKFIGLDEETIWGQLWDFDVAKNFQGETGSDEVSLNFFGTGDMPEDTEVFLIDKDLNRLVKIGNEICCYRFLLGNRRFIDQESESRFILLVGTEDFIENNDDLLPKPPTRTTLCQNHPNPFNPSTVIRYEVAKPQYVSLRIYDVNGSLVRILCDSHRQPDRYEISWNGDNDKGRQVSSGIYFCRLVAGDFAQTKKMVLLR